MSEQFLNDTDHYVMQVASMPTVQGMHIVYHAEMVQKKLRELEEQTRMAYNVTTPYSIHRTAEGDEMLICQMTDTHLINTINLFLKEIETCRKKIRHGILPSDDVLASALNPRLNSEERKKRVESRLQTLFNLIPGYLMEAMARTSIELQSLRLAIQIAFERDNGYPIDLETKALPVSIVDDDDDLA